MGERKPMTTEGYTLPIEIEDKAIAWIRGAASQTFQAHDVARFLMYEGVPRQGVKEIYSPAYSIADRLLQRERKAGTIQFKGKTWRASPPPQPDPAGSSEGQA